MVQCCIELTACKEGDGHHQTQANSTVIALETDLSDLRRHDKPTPLGAKTGHKQWPPPPIGGANHQNPQEFLCKVRATKAFRYLQQSLKRFI